MSDGEADHLGIIEERIGSTVAAFSYPFRFPEENYDFTSFVTEELRSAGYSRGVTTIIARYHQGDDPMLIKRLPANSEDDGEFFESKLKGGYDWLHMPQYMMKRIRSIIHKGGGECLIAELPTSL